MKPNFNFGDFINRIKPSLEAVLVGLALAIADTLINLVGTGQTLNLRGVMVAVAGAAVDFLTSFYRKKRGDVAVMIANQAVAQSESPVVVSVPVNPVVAEVGKQ